MSSLVYAGGGSLLVLAAMSEVEGMISRADAEERGDAALGKVVRVGARVRELDAM